MVYNDPQSCMGTILFPECSASLLRHSQSKRFACLNTAFCFLSGEGEGLINGTFQYTCRQPVNVPISCACSSHEMQFMLKCALVVISCADGCHIFLSSTL